MNMIGILIGITIVTIYLTVLVERTYYLHETVQAWECSIKESYQREGSLCYNAETQALRKKQEDG